MSSKRSLSLLAVGALVSIGCGGGGGGGDDGSETAPALQADACLISDCTCGPAEHQGAVYPVPPDEIGHWAAGRVELPTRPYDVTAVLFGLAEVEDETVTCRFDIPMAVQIFVSESTDPPAEPEVLWEWSGVPPVGDGTDVHMGELPVEGVTVQEGEEMFVSFQMAGTSDGLVCLYSCDEHPTAASDVSWWSNATEPPYNWANFTDFGLDGTGYNIGVRGEVH